MPDIIPIHPHRPLVHFSPKKNWMNDPNGLVYYDGEWHLFYQHYPQEPEAKNIHWGHAVSKDLIKWNELSIAIEPEDELVGIWSGSVVIDWKNVTGFQKDITIHPMIAIYTWQKQGWQEQHMAYSLDRGNDAFLIHTITSKTKYFSLLLKNLFCVCFQGRIWTKYQSNPVILLHNNMSKPNRMSDKIEKFVFRDPKVMFHTATASWILVLTGGYHIQFYKSTDLIHWSFVSRFGDQDGTHNVTWECPDLIEFPQTTSD